MKDKYNLNRFLEVQVSSFKTALREIKKGSKESRGTAERGTEEVF